MISLSPSMTCSNSADATFPIFFPSRSTDKVQIWLILTQDFFGRPLVMSSNVRGKSARSGWSAPSRLGIGCLQIYNPFSSLLAAAAARRC